MTSQARLTLNFKLTHYPKFKSLSESIKEDYNASFRNKVPFVEIYCYAFMPNHYHFLLRQLMNNGIKQFISNMQNSFAKYFNLRHDRDGTLFQHTFKGKRIETDEQFIHVSRYVHLNPVTSYLINFEHLATYSWTSFFEYANAKKEHSFITTEFLLNMFKSRKKYYDFVSDQAEYQRTLSLIKDLV